jgi:hypothetical protein
LDPSTFTYLELASQGYSCSTLNILKYILKRENKKVIKISVKSLYYIYE